MNTKQILQTDLYKKLRFLGAERFVDLISSHLRGAERHLRGAGGPQPWHVASGAATRPPIHRARCAGLRPSRTTSVKKNSFHIWKYDENMMKLPRYYALFTNVPTPLAFFRSVHDTMTILYQIVLASISIFTQQNTRFFVNQCLSLPPCRCVISTVELWKACQPSELVTCGQRNATGNSEMFFEVWAVVISICKYILKITSFGFDHTADISNFYTKVIMIDTEESVTLLPCEGYIVLGLPSPLLQMM